MNGRDFLRTTLAGAAILPSAPPLLSVPVLAEVACRAAEEAVVHSFLLARPVRGKSGRTLETISPERLAGIFRNKEA